MYGHRLENIRNSFLESAQRDAARAIAAGAENAELARIQAKAQQRVATRDYTLMLREFRREVSRLKKNGLLPKEVDARRAQPESGLMARIKNLANVAQGRQRAVKVSKAKAAELREEGYQVRAGRVLVSREFKVSRTGEVEIRSDDGFVLQKRIYLSASPEAIERSVHRIFEGMKEDEVVVIKVGDNLTEFYIRTNRDDFISKLMEYREAKYPLRYVDVVKLPEAEADEWTAEHTADRLGRQGQSQRARRNERARERRRRKQERAAASPSQKPARASKGKGRHIYTPRFPDR